MEGKEHIRKHDNQTQPNPNRSPKSNVYTLMEE